MDIAPLALVVLLGYGLLIAVSLTVWTAVSYGPGNEPTTRSRAAVAGRETVSNDEVRGARKRREREQPGDAEALAGSGRPFAPLAGPQSAARPPLRQPAEPDRGAHRRDRTVPAEATQEQEEDAFERFLRERPDDFDIR